MVRLGWMPLGVGYLLVTSSTATTWPLVSVTVPSWMTASAVSARSYHTMPLRDFDGWFFVLEPSFMLTPYILPNRLNSIQKSSTSKPLGKPTTCTHFGRLLFLMAVGTVHRFWTGGGPSVSGGDDDFGLQSSSFSVQAVFLLSFSKVTSSNMNTVPTMENFLNLRRLTTADGTNFRPAGVLLREHIILPTTNTTNRFAQTCIVSTDLTRTRHRSYPIRAANRCTASGLCAVISSRPWSVNRCSDRQPWNRRNVAGLATSAA